MRKTFPKVRNFSRVSFFRVFMRRSKRGSMSMSRGTGRGRETSSARSSRSRCLRIIQQDNYLLSWVRLIIRHLKTGMASEF